MHLFHLAPNGVYLAANITADAGARLPHRFTLTPKNWMQSLLCCTFRQVTLPGR